MSYEPGFADAAHGSLWHTGVCLGPRFNAMSPGTSGASVAWPANNDAYVIPFQVATSVTFTRMFFMAGTSPGTANFDLGIYRDDFTLVASLGATAAVNTTSGIQPLGGGAFTTAPTLTRGRYYLAMSAAATTITVRAGANANQVQRAIGMFKMASAHPLPNPFVPASMGATTLVPLLGAMTISSVVL